MTPDSWGVVLPLKAVAKGRPRLARGMVYTPAATRKAESLIRMALINANPPKYLTEALALSVTFFIKRPVSVKRKYPTVRPDVDNFVKLLSDAANGICYTDDAQIVDLSCRKLYADRDEIYIRISKLA